MPTSYLSELNLDGTNRTIKDPNAVSTQASQGLSTQQKENARNNIGVSLNYTGTYAQWSLLSASEKALYKTVDFI